MGTELMDCQEVKELLDAYALGAAEKAEADSLERHAADCVRCWEELNEAQRTAALLALAVAMEEAPAALRDRILAQAERQARRKDPFSLLRMLLRRGWPAAAAALAAAGVALAFAAVLQVQMNDLRDENDQMERQVQAAHLLLGQQRQLAAVLSAPDLRELNLMSTSPGSEAMAVYYWSAATGKGFIVCNNLPSLEEGQVYQVWFLSDGEAVSAGTFESWNGIGQLPMDLGALASQPQGIGITVEEAGGSDRPTGEMLLYAPLAYR